MTNSTAPPATPDARVVLQCSSAEVEPWIYVAFFGLTVMVTRWIPDLIVPSRILGTWADHEAEVPRRAEENAEVARVRAERSDAAKGACRRVDERLSALLRPGSEVFPYATPSLAWSRATLLLPDVERLLDIVDAAQAVRESIEASEIGACSSEALDALYEALTR